MVASYSFCFFFSGGYYMVFGLLMMPCAQFICFLSVSTVRLLRFFGIFFSIAHWIDMFSINFSILLVCGMLSICPPPPHALLIHLRRCAPSRNHLRVLLLYFILSHIRTALNSFNFDLVAFSLHMLIQIKVIKIYFFYSNVNI